MFKLAYSHKLAFFVGALALGVIATGLLSGCNSASTTPTAAVPTSAAAKASTLAQVVGGDFTKACTTFNVAVGYYQDVAFLIPTPASTIAAATIVAGNLLCKAPSGNVASDLTQLNTLWTQIQALTTVPK
jgi:hypothetical protein